MGAPAEKVAEEPAGTDVSVDAPPSDESPPAETSFPSPDPATPWWQWPAGNTAFGSNLGAFVAYQDFWNVRKEAFGDPSAYEGELMLKDQLDGDVLTRELDALHKLRDAGRAQVVQVDHHVAYGFMGDEDWVVFDKYVDHSYLVDPRTHESVNGGPPENPVTWFMGYRYHKFPDSTNPAVPYRWKIVDSIHLTN